MSQPSSGYDSTFLSILLAHALRDPNVMRVVHNRIHANDFPLILHQHIWNVACAHYGQYGILAGPEILMYELGKLINQGHIHTDDTLPLARILQSLYQTQLNTVWVLETFENFLRTIRVGGAIALSDEFIRTGNFEGLYHSIQDAFISSHIDQEPVVNPFSQFLFVDRGDVVPTLIPDVDAALDGGLCPGEVGMIMAITGGGKTIFLENITFGAATMKKRVLYCTWEMGATKLSMRLYSCATGIPYKMIKNASPEVAKRVMEMTQRLQPYIYIKEFLKAPASLLDVEAVYNQLAEEQGWKADLIVTDWLDLIQSIQYGGEITRAEPRHVLSAVAVEHTQLSQRLGIPVWTASQANRSAIGRGIVDLRHTAEAYGKAWKLDVVLTLQESPEEENVYNCYTAKNRDNPKRVIRLRGDLDHMRFRSMSGHGG